MDEYAIVVQDTRELTIHRRAENWVPQVIADPAALVEFRSIQFSLPLMRIYDGVL